MQVFTRNLHIAMAESCSNKRDIGATFERMGRHTMPEPVRGHAWGHSGPSCSCINNPPDLRNVQALTGPAAAMKNKVICIAPDRFQIRPKLCGQAHNAGFIPLTKQCDLSTPFPGLKVSPAQAGDLGYSAATYVQKTKQ